jgi:hypothetical protein
VYIPETGETHYIGILNSGAWRKGKKMFGPIGGAAHLTEEGEKYIKKYLEATSIHKNVDGGLDARFIVPNALLGRALQFFETLDPRYSDVDVSDEMFKELTTEELVGIPAILTEEDAREITLTYTGSRRQKVISGPGTSVLTNEEAPSRRLFHFSILNMSLRVFGKMLKSPAIHQFTVEEIASTRDGTQKGRTADGVDIADNVFIP